MTANTVLVLALLSAVASLLLSVFTPLWWVAMPLATGSIAVTALTLGRELGRNGL